MDTAANLVLMSNVVEVAESKNLCTMENDGLICCLNDQQERMYMADVTILHTHIDLMGWIAATT